MSDYKNRWTETMGLPEEYAVKVRSRINSISEKAFRDIGTPSNRHGSHVSDELVVIDAGLNRRNKRIKDLQQACDLALSIIEELKGYADWDMSAELASIKKGLGNNG
jgi:hypothetical protein